MTFGLDIDETITRCPPLFAVLSRALIAEGHKVYVITFRDDSDRETTEVDLREYGIHYSKLIMAGDDDLCGSRFYKWKADVCRRLRVDVLFEDMPEVVNELPASTIAFVPLDRELGSLTYLPGVATEP